MDATPSLATTALPPADHPSERWISALMTALMLLLAAAAAGLIVYLVWYAQQSPVKVAKRVSATMVPALQTASAAGERSCAAVMATPACADIRDQRATGAAAVPFAGAGRVGAGCVAAGNASARARIACARSATEVA